MSLHIVFTSLATIVIDQVVNVSLNNSIIKHQIRMRKGDITRNCYNPELECIINQYLLSKFLDHLIYLLRFSGFLYKANILEFEIG